MGRLWVRVVCTVFAVVVSVFNSIYVFGVDSEVPGSDDLRPTLYTGLSFIVALGAAVMICWRHRWPVLVTAIALVPPLLMRGDSTAALVAVAALVTHHKAYLRWGGAVLTLAATACAVWRDVGHPAESTIAGVVIDTQSFGPKLAGVLTLAAVFTAVPVAFGITRRYRYDSARSIAAQDEMRAEMARRAERTRIARDMHDVLGHRLSLLSLQAGALEVTTDESSKAAEAARTVRTTARQSLEDLRQVIGVLRDGRQDPATPEGGPAQATQPGLTDLPQLIGGARDAGLTVNVTVLLDQAVAAPPPLATAAYRIVQEALTNVLRHAPGAPADVTVHGGPGVGIAIEVVNPLPVTSPGPSPGSGSGLAGANERVILFGGNLSAGPTGQGTFLLRAWLPWAVG